MVSMLNSSILLADGSLTGTAHLSQSEPGSNGNEGVLHIPQSPRLEPDHQIELNGFKYFNLTLIILFNIFVCTLLNGFKYFYVILIILFNICLYIEKFEKF